MNMKKQYTKKQIAEALAFWKSQLKQLDEASYEEGKMYRQSLGKTAGYVVPAVQQAIKANEAPDTIKPIAGEWIDLLDAACAIAYYV